jgi:hypothetical protein
MLSGTKDKGINITNDSSFHVVGETDGISALSESANSTTSATLRSLVGDYRRTYQVAVSSSEKITDTMIRCLCPKASLHISEMEE